jgi:hypothetical protein
MLSMVFLLSKPLAAALGEDAMRAGRRARPLSRFPQRASLLGRFRGRRDVRPSQRPAHA